MGIRFLCPACEKKIHVKDHQAGMRGFCPKCGARVDIPMHSTLLSKRRKGTDLEKVRHPGIAPGAAGDMTIMSLLPPVGRLLSTSPVAPREPLDEFPNYQWYVVPYGGTEPFGPADGSLIRQWMREGRIAARSMVWRQDWSAWRKAGSVWPHLLLAEADAAAAVPGGAGPPRFQSPGVPAMPFNSPPGRMPPPRSAQCTAVDLPPATSLQAPRDWSGGGLAATQSSASSAALVDELYYPRRSHGPYLVMAALLTATLLALGIVMFKVIDNTSRRREGTSRGDRLRPTACFAVSNRPLPATRSLL